MAGGRQTAALLYKTLSLQKRQLCTNICCVCACPIVFVSICGLLPIILIAALPDTQVFYYEGCATATSLEQTDGMYEPSTYSENGYPCLLYAGHDYRPEEYYSVEVNATCDFVNPALCPLKATTVLPTDNPQGWLAVNSLFSLFYSQMNPWFYFRESSNNLVGSKPEVGPIPLYNTTYNFDDQTTGWVQNMPTDFYEIFPDGADFEGLNPEFLSRPYFEEVEGSEEDVDDAIADSINSAIEAISKLDPQDSPLAQAQYYAIEIRRIMETIPFGAVLFDKLGDNGDYDYTLVIGINERLYYLSTYLGEDIDETGGNVTVGPLQQPGKGIRRFYTQNKIANSILREGSGDGYTLTSGIRQFPHRYNTEFDFNPGDLAGSVLYPFACSFLLPIFTLNLVKEKEERIFVMMRMNGLSTAAYYFTEYLHFFTLHVICSFLFLIMGLAFSLSFFTLTQPGVYIWLFIIWGNTQIALAYVFSIFFKSSRVALLVVFLLVLFGLIVNIVTPIFFITEAPIWYLLYPPFCFYRALNLMNEATYSLSLPPYTFAQINSGTEMNRLFVMLILETIVLFLGGAYFQAVTPSEYGVPRPWHFVFTDPYKWFKNRNNTKQVNDKLTLEENLGLIEEEVDLDEDVLAEQERVEKNQYPANSAIVMHGMQKIFGTKVAVKKISFAVDPDTVFGLLGPNGAGKTTLINILTGLYPPTHGHAILAGFSVTESMESVYQNIGVCPQHDILWDDLTVEEHLLFYARLKGVSREEESAAVEKSLSSVSLGGFRERFPPSLSGGERRRLSIAIALIGNGKVVFLDEPTTGLDPEVRRLIWDIINNAKKDKTIVLTTHSMEEAEVLCQCIGIMAKGSLRCIGPQLKLKNKFGSGFKLHISGDSTHINESVKYVEAHLPEGFKKLDSYAGSTTYQFPANVDQVANLFEEMMKNHAENHIQEWGMSQTTLEEVFLKIINEADADAEA
eukprot:Lithocolla_globosa_v1_NODE_102_length_6350_cov_93.725179.p1 type:complete len:962 gc:universal NODE_102_length_6350_cov_93.725179:3330-445(-)